MQYKYVLFTLNHERWFRVVPHKGIQHGAEVIQIDWFENMFPCRKMEIRILFAEGKEQIYLQNKRYVDANFEVENSTMGEGELYW
jgi:hypothetical protein